MEITAINNFKKKIGRTIEGKIETFQNETNGRRIYEFQKNCGNVVKLF